MAQRRRTPTRNFPRIILVAGVLFAGCLVTYGFVQAAGWLQPNSTNSQKPSREGMVPVPKSLVHLRAFDVVHREDVYDLALGDDSYFWLPKTQVQDHPEWITRFDQIIGRVMARDKRAEFVFSEKDFLPEGSRSGISGGIPSGKQGFFLDAEKVPGLRFLKAGDRFDLLATEPTPRQDATPEYGLLMGGIKARAGKPIPLNGVQILVQDAELIALTTDRSMTTQGGLQLAATDSRGRSLAKANDERVAIAIDPAESVPLTQALGNGSIIHMVTRSGQDSAVEDTQDMLQGRIAIPAAAVSIDAFQAIRASDLAEPNTGDLRQYYFKPNDLQEGWISRPEDLIGRVVARAIEPGYIFSESDFLMPGSVVKSIKAYEAISAQDLVLGGEPHWVGRVAATDLSPGDRISESDLLPKGTKPGIASAIPANRLAFTIDISDVRGTSKLTRGNRCDLLASTALDLSTTLRGIEVSPSLINELESRSVNRVLASDAIVIEKLDQQVVLAADAAGVSLVAKELASKTPIFCVVRTDSEKHVETTGSRGQRTDDLQSQDGLTSDPDPFEEIAITETLIGGKRRVRAYRRTP